MRVIHMTRMSAFALMMLTTLMATFATGVELTIDKQGVVKSFGGEDLPFRCMTRDNATLEWFELVKTTKHPTGFLLKYKDTNGLIGKMPVVHLRVNHFDQVTIVAEDRKGSRLMPREFSAVIDLDLSAESQSYFKRNSIFNKNKLPVLEAGFCGSTM